MVSVVPDHVILGSTPIKDGYFSFQSYSLELDAQTGLPVLAPVGSLFPVALSAATLGIWIYNGSLNIDGYATRISLDPITLDVQSLDPTGSTILKMANGTEVWLFNFGYWVVNNSATETWQKYRYTSLQNSMFSRYLIRDFNH